MFEGIWWEAINKKKKSPGDYLFLALLEFISLFYYMGLHLKKALYGWGVLKPADIKARIICAGNITVGGTGKTPFIEEISRRILKAEKSLLIVEKGYKRDRIKDVDVVSDGQNILMKARNAGDEPFMLARNLRKAKVVVSSDKIRGIREGLALFNPDIVLLDDGFQKREKLVNAEQVVLIDALNPFGNGKIFPAGTLREPASSLRNADCVVLTNTNLVESGEKLEAIKRAILNQNKNLKIFDSEHQPKFFYNVSTQEKEGTGFIKNKKIVYFCSIGNPAGFEKTLKLLGAHIIVGLRFEDHHKFHEKEISGIERLLEKTEAEIAVTTEKDEVRLLKKHLKTQKIFALKIGMFIKNMPELEKKLRIG